MQKTDKSNRTLSKKSNKKESNKTISNILQVPVDLHKLEETIGYIFIDTKLLITALTHSSAVNELPEREKKTILEHNERFEFLGDAILELVISEELFSRYQNVREGVLTHTRSSLVNEQVLAELAKKISLDKYLYLGKGADSQGGRQLPSILSDAYEALLAAIYLDAKNNAKYKNQLEPIVTLIQKNFNDLWPEIAIPKKSKDYKTLLQELTQERFKDTPKYALIESTGLAHEMQFTIELTLPNNLKITQTAKNKRTAEQEAAAKALEILKS